MKGFNLQQRIWRALYPMLLYLLISIAISFAVSAVYTAILIGTEPYASEVIDVDQFVEIALQYLTDNPLLLSLWGYIGALAVFIPVWLKTKTRYPRWNGGKFSVPVALCSAGAAVGINMIFSVIFTVTGLTELFESHDIVVYAVSGGSLPLQIIAAGFIAPVAEELCFRGVTLNNMSDTKKWLAIAVQAVLFGILHLNLLQCIYAALLGVFLGFLTVRYRNIIYAVIAHIAFNMYSIILGTIKSDVALTVIGIVTILLMALSIYGLFRCKKPEPYIEPEKVPAVPEG